MISLLDNRFVNRLIHMQNCIAHILYYIYSDRCFCVHCTPNQLQIIKGARAHHLVIYSSVSRLPSVMSLRTVAHRNMSTTRLYRYYRRKTNSYHGENFYRYIANVKILAPRYVYDMRPGSTDQCSSVTETLLTNVPQSTAALAFRAKRR